MKYIIPFGTFLTGLAAALALVLCFQILQNPRGEGTDVALMQPMIFSLGFIIVTALLTIVGFLFFRKGNGKAPTSTKLGGTLALLSLGVWVYLFATQT